MEVSRKTFIQRYRSMLLVGAVMTGIMLLAAYLWPRKFGFCPRTYDLPKNESPYVPSVFQPGADNRDPEKFVSTEDWKTYTDPIYKYSIKYPLGWEIADCEPVEKLNIKEVEVNALCIKSPNFDGNGMYYGKKPGVQVRIDTQYNPLGDKGDKLGYKAEEVCEEISECHELQLGDWDVVYWEDGVTVPLGIVLVQVPSLRNIGVLSDNGRISVQIQAWYSTGDNNNNEYLKVFNSMLTTFQLDKEDDPGLIENWQTYEDEEYGFRFRYPHHYGVKAKDYSYTTLGEYVESHEQTISEYRHKNMTFYPSLTISLELNSKKLTTQEWIEQSINYRDYKTEKYKTVLFGQENAYHYSASTSAIGKLEIYVLHRQLGDYIVEVRVDYPENNEFALQRMKREFQNIIDTFEVTK